MISFYQSIMHTNHIIFPLIPVRNSLLYSLVRTNTEFLKWYNLANNSNNNNYEDTNVISSHNIEFYYKYKFTSRYYIKNNIIQNDEYNAKQNQYPMYDTLEAYLLLRHGKNDYCEKILHNIHYGKTKNVNYDITTRPGITYTINTQYSLLKNNIPVNFSDLDSTLLDIMWNYEKMKK